MPFHILLAMVALVTPGMALRRHVHGLVKTAEQERTTSLNSVGKSDSWMHVENLNSYNKRLVPYRVKSFAAFLLAAKNPTTSWQAIGHCYKVALSPCDGSSVGCRWKRHFISERTVPTHVLARSKQRFWMSASGSNNATDISSTAASASLTAARGSSDGADVSSTVASAFITANSAHSVHIWRLPRRIFNLLMAAACLLAVRHVELKSAYWVFVLGFVGGGFFFSTAKAAAIAFCTFGAKRSNKTCRLFMLLVRRVWVMIVSMFRAALQCCLGQACPVPKPDSGGNIVSTSRWAAARATLRDGFAQARQMASEGVKAIKLDASLYTKAVAKPGLVILQYLVGKLMPRSIAGVMSDELTKILAEVSHPTVRSVKLKKFDVGTAEPQLLAARLYDLGVEDCAMDVDVNWDSLIAADITVITNVGARIPVTVRDMHFEGPVRVVVTKLSKKAPHYGAFLVSLPSAPTLHFDLVVAGGLRLPWLRSELEKSIQDEMTQQLIWPRRLVIPAMPPPKEEPEPVLSPADLAALEHDDPLLRAERELAKQSPRNANHAASNVTVVDEQRELTNVAERKNATPSNLGLLRYFRNIYNSSYQVLQALAAAPAPPLKANVTVANATVINRRRQQVVEKQRKSTQADKETDVEVSGEPSQDELWGIGNIFNSSYQAIQGVAEGAGDLEPSQILLLKYFESLFGDSTLETRPDLANDTAGVMSGDEQRESQDADVEKVVEASQLDLSTYFDSFFNNSEQLVPSDANITVSNITAVDVQREPADANAGSDLAKYFGDIVNNSYNVIQALTAQQSAANDTASNQTIGANMTVGDEELQSADVTDALSKYFGSIINNSYQVLQTLAVGDANGTVANVTVGGKEHESADAAETGEENSSEIALVKYFQSFFGESPNDENGTVADITAGDEQPDSEDADDGESSEASGTAFWNLDAFFGKSGSAAATDDANDAVVETVANITVNDGQRESTELVLEAAADPAMDPATERSQRGLSRYFRSLYGLRASRGMRASPRDGSTTIANVTVGKQLESADTVEGAAV